jgi:hypothetical protein
MIHSDKFQGANGLTANIVKFTSKEGTSYVQGFFKIPSADNMEIVLLNCGPNCNLIGSESSERKSIQAEVKAGSANRADCSNAETNDFAMCLGIKLGLFCLPILGFIPVTEGCEATCEICKLYFNHPNIVY